LGPMPSLEGARADVERRLVRLYRDRRGNMTPEQAAAMVNRFGAKPWKAIARAIVERGPETDSSADLPSATHSTPSSPGHAQINEHLPEETRRQEMITYARLRRPALIPSIMETFAAHPDVRITDAHVTAVALECGILDELDLVSLEGELASDCRLRIRHFIATVTPQRPQEDIEALLERYREREVALIAALHLKYRGSSVVPPPAETSPQQPRAPPAFPRDDATADMVVRALLTTDNLDDDLATALRCSVESL
jgi:hypothetical protein